MIKLKLTSYTDANPRSKNHTNLYHKSKTLVPDAAVCQIHAHEQGQQCHTHVVPAQWSIFP
jgi:hypothetical protein